MQTILDYGIRYYCYNLHCLVVTAAEGLPNSIGVVCSLGVSMVLVRYSLSKDSYGADNLGRVTIGVRVDSHSPVHRAVLAGNLLMDWLAHLPGHGGALLHLGRHGNTDGDGPAVSDGLVHTGGLWHSPGDGGTLGHWLGVAHGVGDLPGSGPAFGPWNSHTLGNCDTLGNSNTFGNSNGAGSLDRNLPALSVNFLLALRSNGNRSNSDRSNGSSYSSRGSSKGKWCWASR